MDYNYSKLRGAIKEHYGNQVDFARSMGMSPTTLSLKLNNESDWTQAEMSRAMDLIGIETSEVPAYFFAPMV